MTYTFYDSEISYRKHFVTAMKKHPFPENISFPCYSVCLSNRVEGNIDADVHVDDTLPSFFPFCKLRKNFLHLDHMFIFQALWT